MPTKQGYVMKQGACPVCGRNCHIQIHMLGDEITKVERDRDSR